MANDTDALQGVPDGEPVAQADTTLSETATEGNAAEAGGSEKTETTPEDDAEAKAERERERAARDPFRKRIDKLTAQKSALEREVELLRTRAAPVEGLNPDIEAIALAKADEIVRRKEFDRACDRTYDEGVKAYPDFSEKLSDLRLIDGFSPEVIEDMLETGSAHQVLYRLASDPEEADRIFNLPPKRRVIELTKLAVTVAKPPEKPVSKAPPPVKPVGNSRSNDSLTDDLDINEWLKRRNKSVER